MPSVTFEVYGKPAPQGSKTRTGNGGLRESSRDVLPWRELVVSVVRDKLAGRNAPRLDMPLSVDVTFYLLRPKSAPKRVTVPARKPDIDKLLRSTLDALTLSAFITDDALVTDIAMRKRFETDRPGGGAGATIIIKPLQL